MASETIKVGTKAYELAYRCDIAGLTALLENTDKKVLDNHDNADGTTILMVASRDGNTTVVSALLALGPQRLDREVSDKTGWTALHWAACGATDIAGSGIRITPTANVVRLLLGAGLNYDAKSLDGETPVDVALKMLNAPALTLFSQWSANHGGRPVGVKIGGVGNGFVDAKYTGDDNWESGSIGGNSTPPTPTPSTTPKPTKAKLEAPKNPPAASRSAHEAVGGAITPPAHGHSASKVVEDDPQFPW